MELSFACLIIAQFIVVAAHDWIDIPGLVRGSQAQAVIGRGKLAWATLINSVFPGIAAAFAIRYLHAPKPRFVLNYWQVYTAVTVASAIFMWWVPYLFGSSPRHRELYGKLYAGTRFVLPVRRGDPGPNLIHLFFHALFVSTLVLALVQAR